jgi:hypothetical protein
LISHFGWSAIFWVNVPIGVIGFIAGLSILPKNTDKAKAEPYLGSVLFVIGIVALLYTVSNAETWGWSSVKTVLGLCGSGVVLALFALREYRAEFPMIDFSIYKIRAFTTGNIASLLSFISLFCTNVMMPFILKTY